MGKVATMKSRAPKQGVLVMQLGALVFAEPALKNLCALQLPAAALYRLSKIVKAVTEETKHYHERRDALIQELGTANGRQVSIPSEIDGTPNPNLDAFVTRMTEIAQIEVELSVTPFRLDDLGDQTAKTEDILALGALVSDDEPKGTS